MKLSKSSKRLAARVKAFESMGNGGMVNGRKVSGIVNNGAFHKPGSNKK